MFSLKRRVASAGMMMGCGFMLAVLGAKGAHAEERPLVEYVNTLRGSDSTPEFSHGNTFPAVAVPFGFNFWTPVTEVNSETWLYTYRTRQLTGFSVSHEPSPWIGDHGSVQVMPMFGKLRIAAVERATPLRHDKETARAHYYRVELPAEGLTVEVSPTNHASKWRLTFAKAGDAYMVFNSINDVAGTVSIDAKAQTVQGYVDHKGPRLYFFARIDKPLSASEVLAGPIATGWVKFDVAAKETVEMAMATSFISVAQARSNLEQEVGTQSFAQVRLAAAAEWEQLLGKIELQGATVEQKVTFYSNLYRSLLYPNSMWESVNGHPKYFSPYSNHVADGKIYVNNGFWDTYRAEWPLLSLLVPSKAAEMLEGFVTAYKDGGWAPRWSGPGYIDCMVGSSSDMVFADSYLRGVTGFDIRAAFASMLKNALTYSDDGRVGRKGNDRSIFKSYVPVESVPESTAWTLEDTINDFGIAQIAKALGDEVHYEYFLNRSLRYVASYSPAVGFFRGKRQDGHWRTPDSQFDPREWGNEYTEGNAWHYSAAVTTDVQGMANLFGGRERLAERLDSVFSASAEFKVGSYSNVIHEMREARATGMGQYAHSNEPLHSMIYLYDYANRPASTARRVRQVLARLYDSGVGTGRGYLGDEDNGQLSAWYLFSALGFYPASPGHAEYAIGSPLFRQATLHLENSKQFTVSAPENSSRNVYIQSAMLNGAPYSKSYLSHADIMAGGLLELKMGPAPSKWASGVDDVPSSITSALDSQPPVFRADLAVGGTITEGPIGPIGPDAAMLFDDDSDTYWGAPGHKFTIQYRFANTKKHIASLYTVTSAKDNPEADPRDWLLQASDDCVHWQTIDQRTNQHFNWRQQTQVFAVRNPAPHACYRFAIEANHGARFTRVAELELIGAAPPTAATSGGKLH